MVRLVFRKDPVHLVHFHRVSSLSWGIHFWDTPEKRVGRLVIVNFKSGEFSMKMHKAPGNRPNRCCQQGRRVEKCFGLARFLWRPLLDSASPAELHCPDLVFKNNSWDWEGEVVAVCRLLWVTGGKKRKSGSPNCILNYSHCSIPFLKVLGAFKKKSPFWSGKTMAGGEQRGAGCIHLPIPSLKVLCL